MKKINPAHIEMMLKMANQSPYFQLLSMRLCQVDWGVSQVEMDFGEKHMNSFGEIHGGAYASMIDTAAYCAVYCDLAEDVGLISLDLQVDDLGRTQPGKLLAKGKRIKVGRSICLAEATIQDAQGKLLAHGKSKLLVTNGLQSRDQVTAVKEGQAFPPKFLPAE